MLARMLEPYCRGIELVPLRASLPREVASLTSSLAQGDWYLLRRERARAMQQIVKQTIRREQIEAIHLDRVGMAQFIPPWWNRPVIVDGRSMDWTAAQSERERSANPARRWLLGRESRLLRAMEASAFRRAIVTLARIETQRIREHERELLRAYRYVTVASERDQIALVGSELPLQNQEEEDGDEPGAESLVELAPLGASPALPETAPSPRCGCCPAALT